MDVDGLRFNTLSDCHLRLHDPFQEEVRPTSYPGLLGEIGHFLTLDQPEQPRLLERHVGHDRHAIGRSRRQWLKHHSAEPLKIVELADMAGMASSTLHHNFRQLTGTSPLQYQKTSRFHAARNLMLTERMGGSTAALRVGYESVAQFSREYARRFGLPPSRDMKQTRNDGPRAGELVHDQAAHITGH